MSRVVIILGAGASKDAGAPLMNDFLARAQDLLLLDKRLDDAVAPDFKAVFEAIGELHAANTKSNLNVRNLESVWSAFEMAKQIKSLGRLKGDDAAKPFRAIRNLILETLEKSIGFPFNGRHLDPPHPYDQFADLIKHIQQKLKLDVSILTFNYDLCTEIAFNIKGIPYDYCLGREAGSETVSLLKLHGSLNWAYYPETQAVEAYPLHEILKQFDFFRQEGSPAFLSIRKAMVKIMEKKGSATTSPILPFIVPPSLSKTEDQSKIFSVWAQASEELKSAQHIFVFGYSLPENDSFFKYLYSLGTISPTVLKSFMVFDPNKAEVEARYRKFLGQYALDCFETLPYKFDRGIQYLLGTTRDNYFTRW